MTPLYYDNNKKGLVSDGTKLLECCCDDCPCSCGASLSLTNGQPITLHIKIKVPYNPGFAIVSRCITQIRNGNFDPELPIYYSEAPCVNGKYTVRWLDGTFFHDIHIGISGDCNCESGANCVYRICGWTDLGFPDGVNPGDNFSILDITTTNGC